MSEERYCMKCVTTRRCCIALLFFFGVVRLCGLSVGSDSVVSRQGSPTFPQSDTDNEMNGFAAFEAGFTLEDSSTSCTFDSFFPVSGSVLMNSGTLYLLKDLLLDRGTILVSMGSIYGGGHVLECSSSVTAFVAASTITFDDVSVILNGDIALQSSVIVQGNCSINGQGKKFFLESGGQITVASGGQMTFKNMKLSGLSGTNIYCAAASSSIMFKNCEICLASDFEFTTGSILFERDVVISGTTQLTYSSNQVSTIASQSRLLVDQGMTFYYAPSVANRDLLSMTDKSSCLYLDGCALKSTETGIRLTRGRLFIDNGVTFSCAGTESSESICFGNGTASGDLDVTLLSGALLDVYGGLYENNVG